MDVHAKARFIRMSPRKVRLIVDLIRGMSVAEADAQLSFLHRAAALPVRKLLLSAIANAEHNFHLNRTDLRIKTITVDGGPTLKRFRPRAMGRAAPLRKRTSHIGLILSDVAKDGTVSATAVTDVKEVKATTESKVKKTTKPRVTKKAVSSTENKA